MRKKKEARPGFTFFPESWRADEALQTCSLGARGLWIEMMCLMHKSPRYGYLILANGKAPTINELALQVRAPTEEVDRYFEELKSASVFGQISMRNASETGYKTCTFCVFSRRMLRDEKQHRSWRKWQKAHRLSKHDVSANVSKSVRPLSTVSVSVPVSVPVFKERSAKQTAQDANRPSPSFEGVWFQVSEGQDRLLASAFPFVDRQVEYKKADSWCENNPGRRPKRNFGRFLHNWLGRIAVPSDFSKGATRGENLTRKNLAAAGFTA